MSVKLGSDQLLEFHQEMLVIFNKEFEELSEELSKLAPTDEHNRQRIETSKEKIKKKIIEQQTTILKLETETNNIIKEANIFLLEQRLQKQKISNEDAEKLLILYLASPKFEKKEIEKCNQIAAHLAENGDSSINERLPKLQKILTARIRASELISTRKLEEEQLILAKKLIDELLNILKELPLSESMGVAEDIRTLLGLCKPGEDAEKKLKEEYEKDHDQTIEELNKILLNKIPKPKPSEVTASPSTPAAAAAAAPSAATSLSPSLRTSSSSSSAVGGSSQPSSSSSAHTASSQGQGGARPSLALEGGGGRTLFFKHGIAHQIQNPTFVMHKEKGPLTPEVFNQAKQKLIETVQTIERQSISNFSHSTTSTSTEEDLDLSVLQGLRFDQSNPNQTTVSVRRTVRASDLTSLASSSSSSVPSSPQPPETEEDAMTMTLRKTAVEIEAGHPNPDDDELYAMVLAAKIMADKIGKTSFTIEHCEENPEAAFKLYLIGKSMGLEPRFKENAPHKTGETANGIEKSEYGKKTLRTKSGEEQTIAAIYGKVKNENLPEDRLREYIATLERTSSPPRP